MFRKSLMTFTMLVSLPALANAWYVNAKSSNIAQGTISPAGNSANIAANVDSGEYTVAPVSGYTVSRVTLDGVAVAPNGNGKYVAPYAATKSWRYLVAYFAAAKFNITTSFTGNGAIREDDFESLTNIPAGQARQLLVIPNPGSTITTVTAPGASSIIDNADGLSKTVIFNNLQANQTVAAEFAVAPVRTVDAGPDVNTGDVSRYAATLYGSASSNQGSIAYLWSGTGLTFGTPTAATTTVYAATPGTYTATLKATSGGVEVTDTVQVVAQKKVQAFANECASCHSGEGTFPQVFADYYAGAHFNGSGHTTGTCQRCHATEGSIAAADAGWTGSYATLIANQAAVWTPLTNPPTSLTSSNGIACQVCHEAHVGPQPHLRAVNTYTAGAVVPWAPAGAEYNICTSCHTVTDNSGALVGNYHDGSSPSLARTISDSHYDNPATGVGLASTTIEGYAIRKNTDHACADCHNVHMADLEIQEQWAESGHAGKISTQKVDALATASLAYYAAPAGTDPMTVIRPGSTRTYYEDYIRTIVPAANGTPSATVTARAAGVTGTSGAAWEHYNWDQTSSRGTCQKCHTATGASNYLSSPATYAPANNDFSHLSGWTATAGSPQNEVLYCWGCHKDVSTGELHNPGAVTADYKFKGVSAVFPDSGASNGCFVCHAGQASGESITALTAAGNNFTNVSFVNSHYMAAAGLMYVKSGYTNFVDPATVIGTSTYGKSLTSDADGGALTSTHRKLGTAAIRGDSHNAAFFVAGNLDSDGPCVVCHMAGPVTVQVAGGPAPAPAKDHTWEMGEAAMTQVCNQCHGAEIRTDPLDPATATVEKLHLFIEEEGAEPFQAALTLALNQLLAKYNISYNQAVYPYFYDNNISATAAVKDWTRGGALTAAQAEKLMGAAFNINLLKRDPAAHAHARTYARRLLYDTIDFLDDKTINMSTGATALAADPVTYVKDTTAGGTTSAEFKYLAGYNRTTLVWNALERP